MRCNLLALAAIVPSGKCSSTETSSRSRSASAPLITLSSATPDFLRPMLGSSSQIPARPPDESGGSLIDFLERTIDPNSPEHDRLAFTTELVSIGLVRLGRVGPANGGPRGSDALYL